ncbi:hypothetical protein LSAT2_000402 [Lamellibrachia satsuma]|nr:hypothetical protein LSAT2_000402 [Lamellibrachia satsuma]
MTTLFHTQEPNEKVIEGGCRDFQTCCRAPAPGLRSGPPLLPPPAAGPPLLGLRYRAPPSRQEPTKAAVKSKCENRGASSLSAFIDVARARRANLVLVSRHRQKHEPLLFCLNGKLSCI